MTTKKTISKDISNNLGIALTDSNKILDKFIVFIINGLRSNIKIKISGFGTFDKINTTKRIGRNPKTGDSYIICSKNKPKFQAARKIKQALN